MRVLDSLILQTDIPNDNTKMYVEFEDNGFVYVHIDGCDKLVRLGRKELVDLNSFIKDKLMKKRI